jgi:glycosyltransferase involved in cell wall biosynthesis
VSGLRIAFVTPELASDENPSGGLGNYVQRMSRALADAGHQPEVFTLTQGAPNTTRRDGFRVQRIQRAESSRWVRGALRVCKLLGLRSLQPAILMLLDAHALARAVAAAEREAPFAFVHSADHLGAGYFIATSPRRPHLVRYSAVNELWAEAIGENSARMRWASRLSLACARRATHSYAPSRFVADHHRSHYGIDAAVVRPPIFREIAPQAGDLPELPKRYLLHFGQLNGCKGSDLVAEALPRAWSQEPDLEMIWAGTDRTRHFDVWSRAWGPRREQVTWLGEVAKPALYAVLQGAEASVLPSRVDNLPNTAIESLLFGVPVIASDGASLDELIEPGVSGELVPIGDVDSLADAMVRVWRGESAARKGFTWSGEIARAMRPDRAIEALFALAGVLDPSGQGSERSLGEDSQDR